MSNEENGLSNEKQLFPLFDIDDILPILSEISILAGLPDKQLYTLFRLLKSRIRCFIWLWIGPLNWAKRMEHIVICLRKVLKERQKE